MDETTKQIDEVKKETVLAVVATPVRPKKPRARRAKAGPLPDALPKTPEPITPAKPPETLEQRLEAMAKLGATDEEVRLVLQLSAQQMTDFSEALIRARAERRAELRKTQTNLAFAGNEQLLKMLGEFELEQTKRAQERRRESLPDLIKYPNYGYPPGDPRVLLMDHNKKVDAADIIRLARLVRSYATSNPGHTWLDCIKSLSDLFRVDVMEGWEGQPPSWAEVLAKEKLGGSNA